MHTTCMSGPTSSALILALLGLVSADTTQTPVVPHAPVPEIYETASTVDQVESEIAKLERSIRNGLKTVKPQTPAPVAHLASPDPRPMNKPAGETGEPAPSNAALNEPAQNKPAEAISSKTESMPEPSVGPPSTPVANELNEAAVRVTLKPLDATYTRLAPVQISPHAKQQVTALAKAYQPKASGKEGVPVDWLPRETRKALGGNGPRDVVLLAATNEFAWYTWAEADAAWVGRIDLADLTQIQAGPLPTEGPFEVTGFQRLIDYPGQPLTIKDVKGNLVPMISR